MWVSLVKKLSTSRAVKSLYGTQLKPGMKGPYPSKLKGSVDAETAARDRPQKLSVAKMILASFLGIFFTWYPHFRASLQAESSASTPTKAVFFRKNKKKHKTSRITEYALHRYWVSYVQLFKLLTVNMVIRFKQLS